MQYLYLKLAYGPKNRNPTPSSRPIPSSNVFARLIQNDLRIDGNSSVTQHDSTGRILSQVEWWHWLICSRWKVFSLLFDGFFSDSTAIVFRLTFHLCDPFIKLRLKRVSEEGAKAESCSCLASSTTLCMTSGIWSDGGRTPRLRSGQAGHLDLPGHSDPAHA
jgi:hypothetical protein